MPPISKDLQALFERIENMEQRYGLGDVAYMKSQFHMLQHHAESLEAALEQIRDIDITTATLRERVRRRLGDAGDAVKLLDEVEKLEAIVEIAATFNDESFFNMEYDECNICGAGHDYDYHSESAGGIHLAHKPDCAVKRLYEALEKLRDNPPASADTKG